MEVVRLNEGVRPSDSSASSFWTSKVDLFRGFELAIDDRELSYKVAVIVMQMERFMTYNKGPTTPSGACHNP